MWQDTLNLKSSRHLHTYIAAAATTHANMKNKPKKDETKTKPLSKDVKHEHTITYYFI